MTTDSILMTSPRPPLNRPHANAEDHQARFAAISARTPVDEDFREAFLRDKLFIAKTHSHLDISARNQAVASLAGRLGQEAAEMATQPRPGGVGEGFLVRGNQSEKSAAIRMRKHRWVCDAGRA